MSCENWVSQILEILIQLNSSRRYDRIEVLHAYVTIKIKRSSFLRLGHLVSCDNWVSRILEILIQFDSFRRYDCVEVLHVYVTIEIKEVFLRVFSWFTCLRSFVVHVFKMHSCGSHF